MAKGKYQEWLQKDKLLLLKGWAMNGLTDEQIAKNIGIKRPTLYDWKNKYSDISDALKKGKEVADYEVENALFKKATGFEFEETKTTIQIDPDGKKTVNTTKVKRVNPPDTGAAIFWLKNRKPEIWQNKPTDAREKMQAEIDKAKAEAKLAMREAEIEVEEFESDGFLEALQGKVDEVWSEEE